MGSNKDDKRKQEELRRQQEQDRALFTQTFQQANTKSPLEQAREAEDLKWLNWSSGKDGPVDIMRAPGLGVARSLFDYGRARRDDPKQGVGVLRLGLNSTSPEYAANLAEQSQSRREEDAAGRLENAVALKDAAVRGDLGDLMRLQTSRNMGLASLAGNQSGGSTGLWASFRPRPSGWATLGQALLGVGGSFATGAATGGFGAGGRWNRTT